MGTTAVVDDVAGNARYVGPRRVIAVLLTIALLTAFGEAFLLPAILPSHLSAVVQAIIDALLLVLILAPTVWWLMIRPLRDGHEEAEFRFRDLIESSPDGVLAVDQQGLIRMANGQAEELFGYSRTDLVGRPVEMLLPGMVRARHVANRTEFQRQPQLRPMGTGRDLRALRKDGSEFPVEVSLSPMPRDAEPLVIATVRDVTRRHERERALRESEQRYSAVVQQIDEIVYNVDMAADSFAGRVVFVSDRVERVTGHTPQEFMEHPQLWRSLIHPDDVSSVASLTDRLLSERTSVTRLYRLRNDRTGDYLWFEDRVTPYVSGDGALVTLIGVARDITERQRASDALKDANMRLQSLSRRLLTIQETERRSLARELHDEIGQALTATKINLQALERFPDSATLVLRLRDANSIVDRALDQVRSLSLELRPPLLDDLGLPAALRWLLDQYARRSGLQGQFGGDPFEGRLAAEVETACFRVAQQGLTNVERHAGARTVTVELRRVEDTLHLHVRDDGAGFDVPAARARAVHGGSLGLLSMEERAALAGGGIEWTSAPGRGTEMHAWFALAPKTTP
jgi:PAS domain S-box-containing protein